MASLTTSDVKKRNKENILHYIYVNQRTCQQEICELLGLSRPTVIPIIHEYEALNIIEKNGYYESTGGRKANAIRFCSDAKIAIGVELLKSSYEISALDLYGKTVALQSYPVPFVNNDSYYNTVCTSILAFIEEHQFSKPKILGIGIVLQGLISSDGKCVTYGKILNCTGLTIDSFTKMLPYPCKFFHDAEAATQDELWQSPNLKNAIYMNIREHISGAVVVNRKFLKGTELKSGVFEHMTLIPNGRSCYCGHKGCVETYCSTATLTDDEASLSEFFIALRNGDKDAEKKWISYQNHLSSSINNLHMFIDYPVILGGTIASFLRKEDIDVLLKTIYEHTAFPTNARFIQASCCPGSPISRGAAIPYISKYLKELMGNNSSFHVI